MKKKKIIVKEKETVLYNNKVRITRDANDNISFETSSSITCDLLEGIIYCMKYEDMENSLIWSLPIFEVDYYTINTNRVLYWLSGGDKDWVINEVYNKKWGDICHEFEDKYSSALIEDVLNCKTFYEVKNILIKKYNITYMFDFALSLKLIKGW